MYVLVNMYVLVDLARVYQMKRLVSAQIILRRLVSTIASAVVATTQSEQQPLIVFAYHRLISAVRFHCLIANRMKHLLNAQIVLE